MSKEFVNGKILPTEGVPQIVKKVENLVLMLELPEWARKLQTLSYLPKELVIADPLSYCAGVVRANIAADELLEENSGRTVYFYHAPIHNDTKVAEWERKGALIVDSLRPVPLKSPVLFSAHGVSPQVWLQARKKQLYGKDATCPLVDKTHREVRDLRDKGFTVLLIGHKNHDEIVGTFGEATDNIFIVNPYIKKEELNNLLKSLKDKPIAVRNQTTLAVSDLLDLISYIKKIRPDVNLAKKSDICYATENRQAAVVTAISQAGVDSLIIFGSGPGKKQPSSNSIRLQEVAEKTGCTAYLIEEISEIEYLWFLNVRRIGVSAGASADPLRVAEFLAVMRGLGLKNSQVKKITVEEEPQVFAAAKDFDFRKSP